MVAARGVILLFLIFNRYLNKLKITALCGYLGIMVTKLINKTLVLIAVLFLSGCPFDPDSVVYNPKISDIEGSWEMIGIIPYGVIEFDPKGNGLLIGVSKEGHSFISKFESFKSGEKWFTILWRGFEEEDEPERIQGQIVYGQLCFSDLEDSDMSFCFTRSDKLAEYKLVAEKALEKHRAKQP